LPKRFEVEVVGFGSVTVIPALSHSRILTAEVAAIGDDIEIRRFQGCLGLLGHMGELCPVAADVGYLMGDNKMMFSVDRDLNVVATTPEPRPLVAIERESGSVSEIC
jgi:hypothetical protein